MSSVFFLAILILAYILRLFEQIPLSGRDIGHEWSSKYHMFDSLYMVVITITTVGYGDLYPETVTGQIICMQIGIWGAFLISSVVNTVEFGF